MGRIAHLAMKTDEISSDLIASDLQELATAVRKLAKHARGLGFGTSLFKWLASIAAIYLLILDRTNWRTNMLTSLLVPYIFLSFPEPLFNFFRREQSVRKCIGTIEMPSASMKRKRTSFSQCQCASMRGDVGKWIAFITVVLRLFFPRHFPDWLEIPGALILLLVAAPSLFAHTLRESWVGIIICLAIGCYLLQEHIRASGGFRNSLTQGHGISNTLGIIVLLIYPIWRLIAHFF